MKWIRRWILKIVVKAIRENGIEIGEYRIFDDNGTLTIRSK